MPSRTKAQNKQRAEDCGHYRVSVDADCELHEWIVADRDAVRWMNGICLGGSEVHHIFGRGKDERFEWSCNLILLSTPVHHWVHANKPAATVACLYAKWRKFLADVKKIESRGEQMPPVQFWDWHVGTLDQLVRPVVSLQGKLSVLADGVPKSSIYLAWAKELLGAI